MQIEIYDKSSKEVVETKEVGELKAFLFYWNMQCDTKTYGWRIKKPAKRGE